MKESRRDSLIGQKIGGVTEGRELEWEHRFFSCRAPTQPGISCRPRRWRLNSNRVAEQTD